MPFLDDHGVNIGSIKLKRVINVSAQNIAPTSPKVGDIWVKTDLIVNKIHFKEKGITPTANNGDLWITLDNIETSFNLEKAFSAFCNDKQIIIDQSYDTVKTSINSKNIKAFKNKFMDVYASFNNCSMYKNNKWETITAKYWDGIEWIDFGLKDLSFYSRAYNGNKFMKMDQTGKRSWIINPNTYVLGMCSDLEGNSYIVCSDNSNRMVMKIDKNGNLLKTAYSSNNFIYSVIAHPEENYIHTGDSYYVQRRNKNDLSIIWQVYIDSNVKHLAYDKDFKHVFVGTQDGYVWKITNNSSDPQQTIYKAYAGYLIEALVVDDNGNAYAMSNGGNIMKISPSGSQVWSFNFGSPGSGGNKLVFDSEGYLYSKHNYSSTGGDRGLSKINTSNGSTVNKLIISHEKNENHFLDFDVDRFGNFYILGQYNSSAIEQGNKFFMKKYNRSDFSDIGLLFKMKESTDDTMYYNFIVEESPYNIFKNLWQ